MRCASRFHGTDSGEFGIRETVEGGKLRGYYKTLTHLDLPKIADVAAKIDFLAADKNGWVGNPAPGGEGFGRNK